MSPSAGESSTPVQGTWHVQLCSAFPAHGKTIGSTQDRGIFRTNIYTGSDHPSVSLWVRVASGCLFVSPVQAHLVTAVSKELWDPPCPGALHLERCALVKTCLVTSQVAVISSGLGNCTTVRLSSFSHRHT